MDVNDLIVEIRDANYNRVGQLLPKDLTDFTVVAKYNAVGSWKLTLPSTHPLVDYLKTPGYGLIVSGPQGVILSGPTVSAKNTADFASPKGLWEIEGRDDSIILSEHLAYPTPSTADVTAQIVAYDTITAKAETAMKHFVNVNIGPTAPTERKLSNLTIETDAGLGSTLTISARFNKLDKLLSSIASINSLGYTVEQDGANRVFKVYQPTDRSSTIRMDIDNNQLSSTEYLYRQPEVTRVIVGGAGTAEQRTFVEVSNADSLAGETEWARRIEVFHDARSSQGMDELIGAGNEELSSKGKTIKSLSVTPNDYTTMEYGKDWGLGDIVSVTVNDTEIVQIVTEVGLLVNSNGLTVKATVGEPLKSDVEETLIYLQGKSDDRLDNLERNAEGGASSSRESIVYTSPILTNNQVYKTTVDIAAGYRLLSISTTVPSRVRLYSKLTGQTMDEPRPVTNFPSDFSGLMFDFVTAPSLLSADLSPTVDGFTQDGSTTVPITITNLSGVSNPVQVTLIYVRTE